MMKIGFIGAGKMAQALAKGFIAAGLTKGEHIIASCAPQDPQCKEIFESMGAKASFENHSVIRSSDVVFLAVKPSVIPQVLADIHPSVTSRNLLLSIAMGVTLADLEQGLPTGTRVMRVMPNTPALIRSGASVFVEGTSALPEDIEVTRNLLEAVGTCNQVTEYLLDPITGLSGSGPAYVYIMIEALADGGVKMGLPRELANKLAAQTVLGASRMVLETNTHPGQLKDDVTSPAGSTAEGLHFLERAGLRAALIGAVEIATMKCRENNGSTESSS